MSISRTALPFLLACLLLPGGCASLPRSEPIEVIVAGVEPLQGEGLEMRLLVKLRIQNPNDRPLNFNGVSVRMDLQGKRFATGVSDAVGGVPRFGETVVDVPVSISLFRGARQAIGAVTDGHRNKFAYEVSGKLAGPGFDSQHFRSSGELKLPAEIFEPDN